MSREQTSEGAGKLRCSPEGSEYDLPNVPRYGGVSAVATTATPDGVLMMLGMRSVRLTVEDTRRLAGYLAEAATWVESAQNDGHLVPGQRQRLRPREQSP
jgi:hypothetical protein